MVLKGKLKLEINHVKENTAHHMQKLPESMKMLMVKFAAWRHLDMVWALHDRAVLIINSTNVKSRSDMTCFYWL